MHQSQRIAFLLPNLAGGGLERVTVNLLQALVHDDLNLDLVLAAAEGPYLKDVPPQVRVIDLKTKIADRTQSALKLVPPLIRYLQREQPTVLVAHMVWTNAIAVLAKLLSGQSVPVILWEQMPAIRPQHPLVQQASKWLYPKASAVVAASAGVARHLEHQLAMPDASVQVIYNPVISPSIVQKSQAEVNHPWLQPSEPPVFLAAGRLAEQKDYPTLLQAFAQVRQHRPARLLILGQGPLRPTLENLVADLGLTDDVEMLGFVSNPYAYMRRAAAFVLSSRWEGLPTVLIDALACGCNVVSTDCPHGPQEILDQGKYGSLVPVGDAIALAQAMQDVLDAPRSPQELQNRASDFSLEQAAQAYLQLIKSCLNASR